MRSFQSLDQKEILALAVALEEEDARIFEELADGLRDRFPEQAEKFRQLGQEENTHRHRLLELYRSRFGEHMPLIRREDVRGFVNRRPLWRKRPLGLKTAREQMELMEMETQQFYEAAARTATDAGIRQLLGDLAAEERNHVHAAGEITQCGLSTGDVSKEKRLFALQVIQPGLQGLMDGSISTLAPLFAAALATHKSEAAFLVGLAASLGAGISMGFAEALSDDGSLTGRGHPLTRGGVCGGMTALGGLGHTLPYLIHDVKTATAIAIGVVCVELGIISWIRHRYMDTPWSSAILQVGIGGLLVFLVGILIGES